jgi:hypothetical protein
MAFPSTVYPNALDGVEVRADGINIVYDDDFMYHDRQILQLETYIGISGALIGAGVAGRGPGGLVSPVASGGTALKLAARNTFAAGTLLSVGDADDTAYTEKFRVDWGGVAWAYGGFDASQLLVIPHGVTVAAGTAGRLRWNDDTPGLEYDDGVAWNPVGASAGGAALDLVTMFSYTEAPSPVPETIGDGFFDGAMVGGGMDAYFRSTVDPDLTLPGDLYVMLYDMGPKAGPLDPIPRLVSTLTISANGLQVAEVPLTVVSALPTTDEVLDVPRLYEITVSSAATAGDSALIMSTGFDVR